MSIHIQLEGKAVLCRSRAICQPNTNLVGGVDANPAGLNINRQGYHNCSVFRKV
jgi:hypothetical protein